MSERAFEAAVAAARERVDPSPAERERLAAVAAEVRRRALAAVGDLPVAAEVVQVGSTARDTWTSGDHDVDVFVCFPPDLDRATLERYGLRVGTEVLPDGREEYAEHPYVHGELDGFAVDLVPCYAVESAADIRSAVDRTPFHTAYLEERLDAETAAEIRLFKQFLKGVGVYGSNLRTRGFSGFLAELLVLAYGGFRETLDAAASWHPPVRLDPENHGTTDFDDPLVVVDPTDPGRNVAAVVAPENVARLQHHARAFLADPDADAFVHADPDPLSPAAVRDHLDRRGTTPLAVVFDAPDLVDDQLYPQLRRSVGGLVRGLEDHDFEVLRHDAFAAERAVLFAELSVAERPAVERHEGPPVHVADHAVAFYDAYADTDAYGPFVSGERYAVERDRALTSAAAFARERLGGVALGARVESVVEAGDYDVLVGDETASLAGEFGVEFARYFSPRP